MSHFRSGHLAGKQAPGLLNGGHSGVEVLGRMEVIVNACGTAPITTLLQQYPTYLISCCSGKSHSDGFSAQTKTRSGASILRRVRVNFVTSSSTAAPLSEDAKLSVPAT